MVPFVWDVADVKGQDRELYTPHWRYCAEDKREFAEPDFDDSAWSAVMPDGIVPDVRGAAVVWFRARV